MYTIERHTQILIALMKFHGIRKVVASPGTTNITLLGSLQNDPYFEMYSAVDERSAAFIACGMAAETGEPVALSCTGSTASRNYIPGMTEAYYRGLPVLAITSTQHVGRVGYGYSQVIDRSQLMSDIAVDSILVDVVNTPEDEWACGVAVNRALISLRKNGGSPAHINLVTTYSRDFSVEELPPVKGIRYHSSTAEMPSLNKYKRIAILTGCHEKWSDNLQNTVDRFCEQYNAVVLMNHASNYKGKYGVDHALIISMQNYKCTLLDADLVISIGSISRYNSGMRRATCEMWRVSPDGKIWDPEQITTRVFAMDEELFFQYYTAFAEFSAESKSASSEREHEYAPLWQQEYENIISKAPEVPFSNVWVGQHTISRLPDGCVLHIAGANTARSWNFFRLPKTVECYSNDGTMGIDGQVSALIGESLSNPSRLHFGVVGDLTFFYDMNSVGNRHIGNNLRLMVINNGVGAEFKIYSHPAYNFGEDANPYMAAKGHFGNKSKVLLKHYAEDLGYEYLSATNKEEYLIASERFLTPEQTDRSMIFEVFTDSADESDAIFAMNHIVETPCPVPEPTAKEIIRSKAGNLIRCIAGDEGVNAVKRMLGKQEE